MSEWTLFWGLFDTWNLNYKILEKLEKIEEKKCSYNW